MNPKLLAAAMYLSGAIPLPVVRGAKTPGDCDRCRHRDPEWRDGGWCYMFREAPTPTCAQFTPIQEPHHAK